MGPAAVMDDVFHGPMQPAPGIPNRFGYFILRNDDGTVRMPTALVNADYLRGPFVPTDGFDDVPRFPPNSPEGRLGAPSTADWKGQNLGTGTYGVVDAVKNANLVMKTITLMTGPATDWHKNEPSIFEVFIWQYIASQPGAEAHIVMPLMIYARTPDFGSPDPGLGILQRRFMGTLGDLMARVRRGRFPPDDAARLRNGLVLQIARALAWMHSVGAVHADIKHANILWEAPAFGDLLDLAQARVVLADFSISYSVDQAALDRYVASIPHPNGPLAPVSNTPYTGKYGGSGFFRPLEAIFELPVAPDIHPLADVYSFAMLVAEMEQPDVWPSDPSLMITDIHGFVSNGLHDSFVKLSQAALTPLKTTREPGRYKDYVKEKMVEAVGLLSSFMGGQIGKTIPMSPFHARLQVGARRSLLGAAFNYYPSTRPTMANVVAALEAHIAAHPTGSAFDAPITGREPRGALLHLVPFVFLEKAQ